MAVFAAVGSWGPGPFDNDDAADLLEDLGDIRSPETAIAVLGDALLAVTAAQDYIEAPEMSRGLAAAATVALLRDPALPSPSQLGPRWRAATTPLISDMLRDGARHTVERAFQPHDNEWLELWTEAGLTEEARAALAPYRTGLI